MERNFAEKTNAYLLDYIKFGDTKAGAILTLATAVAGAVASSAPKALSAAGQVRLGALFLTGVLLVAILVFAILVVQSCVGALRPRYPAAQSLHSFPDIASMGRDEYVDAIRGITDEPAASLQYARHNWTLARVASEKFAAIGRATRLLWWLLVVAACYSLAAGAWAALATCSG